MKTVYNDWLKLEMKKTNIEGKPEAASEIQG